MDDERLERVGPEAADRFATLPARPDQAGRAQPPDMPAHQWLRQPHFLDQIGHGRLTAGEAADDPEPVDVGECLVDDPQLAQLFGLVDDRRERRADAGA
jgi:hypothetical protein